MLANHYRPSYIGGSAESVQLEAEALVKVGHQVTVLTPRWVCYSPEVETINDVKVIRHPAPAVNRERYFWGRRGWANSMRLMADSILVAAEDHGGVPDIIHAQDWRAFVAMSQINLRYGSIRQIVTLRDIGLLCPIGVCMLGRSTVPDDCGQAKLHRACIPEMVNIYGGHRAHLQRALGYDLRRRYLEKLRYASSVVFPSRALYDAYSSVIRLDKNVVIPSPVRHEDPIPNYLARGIREVVLGVDKDPTVMFFGKPSPGKGWGLFVAAAKQLSGRARFVHVGPRPTNQLPYIMHVGPMHWWAAQLYMRAATVVVVPPLQVDTLPRTAIEAQAQERWVVGTDRGGVKEIVDRGVGLGGVCVPPERFVETLEKYVDIQWPWNEHEARRAVLVHFSQERIAKLLTQVYSDRT